MLSTGDICFQVFKISRVSDKATKYRYKLRYMPFPKKYDEIELSVFYNIGLVSRCGEEFKEFLPYETLLKKLEDDGYLILGQVIDLTDKGIRFGYSIQSGNKVMISVFAAKILLANIINGRYQK